MYLIEPFCMNLYWPKVLLVRELVKTTQDVEYNHPFH